jgi:hypothetical protein
MATINITVQSLLNAAKYDLQIVDTAGTIGELKTAMETNFSYNADWFDLVFNNQVLDTAETIGYYGIVEGSQLRTHNKISRLATLELRQKSKLDLSALDRLASSNDRSTYDISELPTQYVDDTIYDNPNTYGLIEGRPWIETTSPFTFYEIFGTTTALTATKYVSGNKIYVYASTLDVPSYQNSRVVVNDIELLNVATRGHNMVVLNSYGDLISTANYDTYGSAGARTNLANALNAVASDNIVVLTTWDASALTAGIRTAINTGYGSTNSNTWTAGRVSQLFIGIKI